MGGLRFCDAGVGQGFCPGEESGSRCWSPDCAHDSEPGCAIREALADGSLSYERWQSYVKLQRELDALEVRRNHLLRQEQVRQYKIRERANRRKKKKR